MSASLRRTAPSITMFATTWSGIQITRSSLQKFFSRRPTLMSLFSRSHASAWTQLYRTTVSQLYNCNRNIAKEIMFYEIDFIKQYFFRYIHGISHFSLSFGRMPLLLLSRSDFRQGYNICSLKLDYNDNISQNPGVKDSKYICKEIQLYYLECASLVNNEKQNARAHTYTNINAWTPIYTYTHIHHTHTRTHTQTHENTYTHVHKDTQGYTHARSRAPACIPTNTQCSFAIGGPRLWNHLPDTVKEARSNELFKQILKHSYLDNLSKYRLYSKFVTVPSTLFDLFVVKKWC